MSVKFHTLVDLLRHRALHQPNEEAYEFIETDGTQQRLTYAQLDTHVRSVATQLVIANLSGERALLLYTPGLDYIIAFYACLYAKVTAVPAYPPDPTRLDRTLPRLMSVIEDCQAKAILTTSPIAEMAEGLFQASKLSSDLQWISTDQAQLEDASYWRMPLIKADSLAFLQYTSGSTSKPRGVMLSHHNLLSNMAYSDTVIDYGQNPRAVTWLPPYHDMGLIGSLLQPMYAGFPVTLFSPLDFLSHPLKWLQTISDKRGTCSAGPNFAYDLCVKRITEAQRDALDLSCWSITINGAEPVRADTMQRFCEYFAPCGFKAEAFSPSYGLAEATLFVSGAFKQSSRKKMHYFDQKSLQAREIKHLAESADSATLLVSCGPTGFDMQIVNPETLKICQPDEVGEIWLMHDSISVGYWNKPETNPAQFQAYTACQKGPYLRTGDLGFLHGEELFIAGRIKDVIIVRGRNLYPQDIEYVVERADSHIRPGCLAAFAYPKGETEGLGIVAEIKRPQQENQLADIAKSVEQAVLASHDIRCDYIAFVESKSIPKTSSGKIQRHLCKAMALDGSLETIYIHHPHPQQAAPLHTPPQPASAQEAWLPLVLKEVASVLGTSPDKLVAHEPIVSYGLDSLTRQELIGRLETVAGKGLNGLAINETTTSAQVAAFLTDHKAKVYSQPKEPKPISEASYRFEFYPAYMQLREQLKLIDQVGLKNPYFTAHDGVAQDTTSVSGQKLINYSNYNYLALAGHPFISSAAKTAIDMYGTTVSASRLVSGERPLHQQLERAIASLIGVEDAIVYVSGHATNVSTIGHLFTEGDLIIYDSFSHNSLMQGIKLSGARGIPFPHNDYVALDKILQEHRCLYNRALIVAEGVYSMDGDICPLDRYLEIKHKHKAFLMVDEAHSIGVLGKTGRGAAEHFGVNPNDVDLWMGTLSKSFAGCGGYIAGCKAVVEYLRYSSPSFVYSVGISPPNTAASLAAIKLLLKEPERVEKLKRNSALFLELSRSAGFDTGLSEHTPIIPIILGDSLLALKLSEQLFERGINARPIIYPAVEEKSARLRFFMTASHTEDQIRETVDKLIEASK